MGDGTFEMIVVVSPLNWTWFSISKYLFQFTPTSELPKINAKFEGQDAYATSDLFIQHPTRPDLWKIIGRADDQITLSTGEKVRSLLKDMILN